MRLVLAITVSATFLLMCFGNANAQLAARPPVYVYNPLYGKAPDENAKNWIRLVILRPRDGMTPIFLISPTLFGVADPEILIQLSERQYDLVARHTRANRCVQSDVPISQLFFEVAEHSRSGTRVLCRMTQPQACRYLADLANISDITWEDRKWEMLRLVRSGFGC